MSSILYQALKAEVLMKRKRK
ncbi:hypothetical protein PMI10_04412, partial [Flavobacterium sp. CF136]